MRNFRVTEFWKSHSPTAEYPCRESDLLAGLRKFWVQQSSRGGKKNGGKKRAGKGLCLNTWLGTCRNSRNRLVWLVSGTMELGSTPPNSMARNNSPKAWHHGAYGHHARTPWPEDIACIWTKEKEKRSPTTIHPNHDSLQRPYSFRALLALQDFSVPCNQAIYIYIYTPAWSSSLRMHACRMWSCSSDLYNVV